MDTNYLLVHLVGTNVLSTELGGPHMGRAMSYVNELAKIWGPIAVGILAQLLLIWHQRRQFARQTEIAQKNFELQISNANRQFDQQNALARQQYETARSKEERDEVLRRLNTFYGPFKELRTESRLFYEKFALKLQEEYRAEGKYFRTLSYLIEGKQLGAQDRSLIEQILAIGKRHLDLIESSSGVVDKPELQDLLGKLAAHTRALQLAYEGKLSGPPEAFHNLVFPLAVDGAIESAILRLQRRHTELGGVTVESAQQPSLDDRDPSTIAYYDTHADEYANSTMYMNLSDMYRRFKDHLCNSFLLSAGEARNILDLVTRLRDESTPVSALVWSRFSPRIRELLSTAELTQQRAESILLPALNEIIRGDSIYDQRAFLGIHPSDRTKDFLAKTLRGEGVMRLNRLLLEDSFPKPPNDERKGYIARENISKSNRFGGRILDAGCGAGRDTRYLIENGFMVVSFDASEGMVRKCNEYPHAFGQKLAFSEVTYKEEFDGVWACASLMHLPQAKAREATSRLTSALKPGGVMFISVKEGKGSGRPDSKGRFFEYYNDDTLTRLFEHDYRLVLQETWKSNLQVPEQNGATNWLNLLLKRRERS